MSISDIKGHLNARRVWIRQLHLALLRPEEIELSAINCNGIKTNLQFNCKWSLTVRNGFTGMIGVARKRNMDCDDA
jgi:hypothetical protein